MNDKKHWEGVIGASDHRTVGQRAWCLQKHEWCYPNILCSCCMAALADYELCSACEGDGYVRRKS